MEALLLRCRSGVQYHLGATALDDTSELLHADTLFSALANVYALAYDAEEWVSHVREGRIRISSGLHCAELSWRPDPVFFVPRPPLRYTVVADDPSRAKRLKRVRWVSLGILVEIRAHLEFPTTPDDVPSCALNLLDYPLLGGQYACTDRELAPLRRDEVPAAPFRATLARPRVQVRTPVVEDTYYHAAGLTFTPVSLSEGRSIRGHFYVLVEHELDPDAWRRFLACVRLLADEGVGGERTAGYGWFEEVRAIPLQFHAAGPGDGVHLTLAPVIPADDDELERALHYELFLRGGGSLGAHGDPALHRRRVRMLREGALFRGPVRGRVVDVSPDVNPFPHPLLRCGVNFPLPLGPVA